MAWCLHFLNYRLESLSANCSDTANVFAVRGFEISTEEKKKKYLTNLVSDFVIHIFLVLLEVGFQWYFRWQFPRESDCQYLHV